MPIGPRPFGVGAYGVGGYGRWAAIIYQDRANTSISFGVGAAPIEIMVPAASSGITFTTQASVLRALALYGVTGITFTAEASLSWNWMDIVSCKAGTWQITKLPAYSPNDLVAA
jgi:hypothetical protein